MNVNFTLQRAVFVVLPVFSCLVALAMSQEESYPPQPFEFSYSAEDPEGSHSHSQQGDGTGKVITIVADLCNSQMITFSFRIGNLLMQIEVFVTAYSVQVTGEYTIQLADGRMRTVKYTADENGYRAEIITNELGTESKNPADVTIESSAPTGAEAAQQASAKAAASYAAPVYVPYAYAAGHY